MEPLPTNKRVLTLLGLYPVDGNTCKRNGYILFGSLIVATTFMGCVASVVYFFKSATVNLETALYALSQTFATCNAIFLMVLAYIQRHKIAALFGKLSEVYNERKKICFILMFN